MIEVRRAGDRFATRTDWLESRSSFSFGPHYDPGNVGFGRLAVNNHEIVRAGSGFDTHPHADAEIVTWVLSGALVHQDSRGHSGVVYPGLAQRMSAGSGILHSERNDAYRVGADWRVDPDRVAEPAEFVQMWVLPDEPGLAPSYAQHDLDRADLDRDWLPVASGSQDAAIKINSSGSTLWATVLQPGQRRTLPAAGDHLHVYLARGELELESVGPLQAGDAVRITGPEPLAITGRTEAEVLVWEMTR